MDISKKKLLTIKNEIIKQGCWSRYCDIYTENRENATGKAEYCYYELMRACDFEPKYVGELLKYIQQLERVYKLEKENLVRKEYYFDSFRKWTEMMMSSEFSIKEKLAAKQIENIAIYGAGRHGKLLLKYLSDNGVNVCCFIDKNSSIESVDGKPVFGLEDKIPEVDLIIVTPFGNLDAIKCELKVDCVIMAMNQFFDSEIWSQD